MPSPSVSMAVSSKNWGADAGRTDQTVTEPPDDLTRGGATVGTTAYMSPEQARGQTLDARSDLFSLGAVLYEMATGGRAFEGGNAVIVLETVLRSNPAPPSRLSPAMPRELDRVISKALEKDRELRYQAAAELRADLLRLARDLGTPDPGASGETRLRREGYGGSSGRGSPYLERLAADNMLRRGGDMQIEVFELERAQSKWENLVSHNLSESGVHPMSLEELLPPEERDEILKQRLVYVQTNGTEALRERIASLYPPASAENVIVTTGTAEANFISIWRLVEPGDEVVMMLPNYMQIWGIVRAHGGTIVPWKLREENAWAPDLDELSRLLTPRTKLIAICNPNNPTGAVLSNEAMKAIVAAAEKQGVWILADEIYRGAELDGHETPTFSGMYDRVLAACGLSKAYALPGLRIGWVVGPAETIAELWRRKDYLTIAPSALSDLVARKVLEPETRARVLERTRRIINGNLPLVERWCEGYGSKLRLIPPRAGAITFIRCSFDAGSTEIVDRIRQEQSVLIVPGSHFGMDGFLRIGLGNEANDLRHALEKADEVLKTL